MQCLKKDESLEKKPSKKESKKRRKMNKKLMTEDIRMGKLDSASTKLSENFMTESADSSKQSVAVTLKSFTVVKIIGEGAYGKVYLVKKIDTGILYAMKVIRKSGISSRKDKEQVLTEKDITQQIDSPFIVKLHFSFQSETKFFLILDFMDAGDLCYHIVHKRRIKEPLTTKISAQILLGLKCLHENNILYRDLKPMNILLDQDYRVKLTDFGLSKKDRQEDAPESRHSICGTLQYIAPEVALGKDYHFAIDWWSFGVILYEMISGKLPFDSNERKIIVQKIISSKIKFGRRFTPQAQDLISKLLNTDPDERLGTKGAEEVMEHAFFKDINWEELATSNPVSKRQVKIPKGHFKYCYGNSAESSVLSDKGLTKLDLSNFTFVEALSEEGSESLSSMGSF
ncbi:unnamed protein product [Moneuplotes crassus]|uniref:Protein kinase domain-containing protein n=1 Tax=Euplotes crassus TaxID=5936 RepID=A0AAD1UMF0_EUPCR|nr:unnamed protein product [Moneuplotes crassus]